MQTKWIWFGLFIVLFLGIAGAQLANPVVTPTPTLWRLPQVETTTPTAVLTPGWWADQPTMPPWKTPTSTPTLTRTPKATKPVQGVK
jgi:hypothetical protein